MKLNIEPLQEGDYENILCQWWKDWRWTPPSKDFLPENGTGGFMVSDDGVPVCAGFMYRTNSKAVWCDWIVSNFEYKNKQGRKEAIELLINTIADKVWTEAVISTSLSPTNPVFLMNLQESCLKRKNLDSSS